MRKGPPPLHTISRLQKHIKSTFFPHSIQLPERAAMPPRKQYLYFFFPANIDHKYDPHVGKLCHNRIFGIVIIGTLGTVTFSVVDSHPARLPRLRCPRRHPTESRISAIFTQQWLKCHRARRNFNSYGSVFFHVQ